MAKPEITVTIDETGNVTFDVAGATGSGCKQLTEALEKAMGGGVVSVEKKPEFHHRQSAGGNKVKQG